MMHEPSFETSSEEFQSITDDARKQVQSMYKEISARAGKKRIIAHCDFFRLVGQRAKLPDDTLDFVGILRQTHAAFEPLGTPLDAASDAIPVVVAVLSYIGADLRELDVKNLSDPRDAIVEGTALLSGYLHAKQFIGFQELPHTNEGLEFEFYVSAVVLDNISANDLEIDYQDGKGYQPLRANASYSVNYLDFGTRRISVRSRQLGLEDGFSFENVCRLAPGVSPAVTWDVTGVSLCNYSKGTGHADVVYGAGKINATVDNVFIVSEGFPGGLKFEQIWNILNKNGDLANQMVSNGITVVVLRYSDGTAMIQANAGVAVATYDIMRKEFGSGNPLKIVWSGASMGGVVMMYALRYLLKNNPSVKTADMFFATFDSPLTLQANVPFSIQVLLYALDKQGQLPGSQSDQLQLLKSDAARQMLAYSVTDYQGHFDSELRLNLNQEMSQNLTDWVTPERTAYLVSGSSNASVPTNVPPANAWVFEWSYSSSLLKYVAHLSVTANDDELHQLIVYNIPNSNWTESPLARTVWLKQSHPGWSYDTAPGAVTEQYFGSVWDGFKNKKGHSWLSDNICVCFIPAASAAFATTGDLFTPVGEGCGNVRANMQCAEHLVFDKESISWLQKRIFGYYGIPTEALEDRG